MDGWCRRRHWAVSACRTRLALRAPVSHSEPNSTGPAVLIGDSRVPGSCRGLREGPADAALLRVRGS
eukprot:11074223-Alexandrium_andersonii.AAC.1